MHCWYFSFKNKVFLALDCRIGVQSAGYRWRGRRRQPQQAQTLGGCVAQLLVQLIDGSQGQARSVHRDDARPALGGPGGQLQGGGDRGAQYLRQRRWSKLRDWLMDASPAD
jgi:hypothetical protein